MSTITEYLEELSGRSVTVIGMGISNVPLIKMLLRAGVKVTVRDKANREKVADLAQELESLGATLVLGPDYLKDLGGELIFRTPGLSPNTPELAQAVDREVVRQTGYLERSEIMEESLRDFGCAIVCDSLERCVELANEIAPEHLEIMTEEPRALLPLVKNAGAVFLGAYTPEPLGDYLAGPDHVLPTSGTARFFSPLSVDSFLKTMSVLEFDRAALAPIAGEIITLAETEHLTAHANSIRVRMDG